MGNKIGYKAGQRDVFNSMGIVCNASCVGTMRTVLMVRIKSDVLRNSQSHDYGVG